MVADGKQLEWIKENIAVAMCDAVSKDDNMDKVSDLVADKVACMATGLLHDAAAVPPCVMSPCTSASLALV